ncbi:unnamed protein product [Blepharisma stoltei]|uniref:Uncharacterized protein n=1 Tax=Blepharisma stoltei TaxID=1481888 RepID=A0AAU9J6H2_9CILI|nr:unnamed protein product [Blepharisma stoltei]
MRLFGKKKKKQMSQEEVLKTMEGLRKTLEDIDKRGNLLQNKAQNELQQALQRKKVGDRSGALICLKRKKMYESEVAKLEGSRMNLEQQLFAIEGASMNKNIFDSLKTGNQVLKDVHGEIKIEDVDRLKDDMEEQQDLLQEMNEAISQPIGILSTMDEDELMDELDQLEAKEYEKDMLEAQAGPALQNRNNVIQREPVPAQQVSAANDLDELYNQMQMS